MCVRSFIIFFFFKQKTAYEMRISDWSSDVCSSDLSRLAATSAIRASLFSRARAQTHSAPASVPLIHELEHIRNDVGKCFYQDGSENQRRENRLIIWSRGRFQ